MKHKSSIKEPDIYVISERRHLRKESEEYRYHISYYGEYRICEMTANDAIEVMYSLQKALDTTKRKTVIGDKTTNRLVLTEDIEKQLIALQNGYASSLSDKLEDIIHILLESGYKLSIPDSDLLGNIQALRNASQALLELVPFIEVDLEGNVKEVQS